MCYKLYAVAIVSLQFIVTMFNITLCISFFLKSLCHYVVEQSSYCAGISCSTSMLWFREREPCKHNKQDFSNA